ncbi:MAG TPA: M20 family metallopeptidase [Candidatus Saccharimonadales bacterium]|nr:M20 family metallopeptidase [Candidatus Saccharimonadales bacterium]
MTNVDLHTESQELASQLISDRRRLHRQPELSGHERQTARFIAERLQQLGLSPRLLLDDTAVVVDLQGEKGSGRALLLRADSDALPIQERGEERPYRSEVAGVMHACGHDGHVAIALGTTELLLRHRDQFSGSVRVIFQPAEETAAGAEPMIAAGVMESPTVQAALGLHVWSGQRAGLVGVRDGAIFASADEFALEVRGRGGHGALPHQALDPVPIASLIVLALQTLVSRETSPFQSTVVTIGTIQAGQAFNVIPETVSLSGTVRAFTDEDRERLLRRIAELAQGIAAAFGATASMELKAGCPPVVCDPAMSDLVRRAVNESSGVELIEPEPLTVGDDVGLFLRRVPGCYFLLGAGDPAGGVSAPHHHPDFDLDESCLPIGVEVLARAALIYLRG